MDEFSIRKLAKEKMKGNYLKAFGILIIMGLIINIVSGFITIPIFIFTEGIGIFYDNNIELNYIFLFSNLIILTLSSLVVFLFSGLFQIGYKKCFLDLAQKNELKLETLFFVFNKERFKLVGLYLVMNIFILIGFILFIVPGIYLLLSWSQAIYLMIENPKIQIMEALKESNERMKGKKLSLVKTVIYYILPYLIYILMILLLISINVNLIMQENLKLYGAIQGVLIIILSIIFIIYYTIILVPRMNTALAIFFKEKINKKETMISKDIENIKYEKI